MKPMACYLAGYIQGSVMDECTAWRKKLREVYEDWHGKPYPIVWIDPLNGEDFCEISPDGFKGTMPGHAIVHKDYTSVEKSDLIIANMETFGQDRPLTGTICELAWAWDKHKAIIMITKDQKYKEHPFLEYFASWIVPDVETLIDQKIINTFFKAWHSARY